jgi:hypothetical protein
MRDEVCLADTPMLAVSHRAAKGPIAFVRVGPLVSLPIMVVTVQRACEFSRMGQAWGRCWYSTSLTGRAGHSQGTGTGSSCLAFG